MKGWSGGSDGTKVMVFEVDMPHCGSEGFDDCEHNRPAVWALNGKVRWCVLRAFLWNIILTLEEEEGCDYGLGITVTRRPH